MHYSSATFHIAGDFIVQNQGVAMRQGRHTKEKLKSANRRRSQNVTLSRPKNLPKLCRWQDKCTRARCRFIHLPAEILEGAKKPYWVCWSRPHCTASHCLYVHYSGQEEEEEVAEQTSGGNLPPPKQQPEMPSHLPQSFVHTTGDRINESDDEEEEDLRRWIERVRSSQ